MEYAIDAIPHLAGKLTWLNMDVGRAFVDRLNADVNLALRDPAVRGRFSDLGAEPRESSPEDMAKVMAADIAKWGEIIRKGGITSQ